MLFEPTWFRWLRRIGLAFFAIIILVPLYVMVSSSVKPLGDVQGDFSWWPKHFTTSAFTQIWKTIPLGQYFLNSIIICVSSTVICVLLAVFASYGISRYNFRGRGTFSMTVLSTQMFPGILFLFPLLAIYREVDSWTGLMLEDSKYGLIITYMTFSLPFSIWMMVGYFDSVPKELDEAAMVDGNGPLGALFRVVVPAAVPGIIAVAVYSFMTAWGEVLFSSVLTTKNSDMPVSIGLASYSTSSGVYWNQVMAASLVVSVPVVVGFLLLQRYLVAGLTAGSVK